MKPKAIKAVKKKEIKAWVARNDDTERNVDEMSFAPTEKLIRKRWGGRQVINRVTITIN